MKKILVIAPYAYLPWRSGGQKFIGQFLEYLGRKTALTVISVAANDASLATQYKLLPLLKKGFSRYYDFSLVKKISTLVKEEQFDAVIWEHPYLAWLAFRVCKKTGVRTLFHTHNIEYQRFKSTGRWWWPILKWYERRCFKKADGIFFITPDDKQFAIREWKINPARCYDLPFGIELGAYPDNRQSSREAINQLHGLLPTDKMLLFTGAFNYKPNLDALQFIVEKINPILMKEAGFTYKILVCGGDLPAEWKELRDELSHHIIYAGFIPRIDLYYAAADIFLNPVLSGGGIKTKMVEAIAYGATVISTETGATGINKAVCGSKLVLIPDGDWNAFANAVVKSGQENPSPTPAAYYQQYHWEAIISDVLEKAI
ncbi:MAG: glycosyltransferase family 4 protein [Chitinophagaceae bacterium]|nr:glycosyltransferase family 4 protein [Chitinophagaceae bacterium]